MINDAVTIFSVWVDILFTTLYLGNLVRQNQYYHSLSDLRGHLSTKQPKWVTIQIYSNMQCLFYNVYHHSLQTFMSKRTLLSHYSFSLKGSHNVRKLNHAFKFQNSVISTDLFLIDLRLSAFKCLFQKPCNHFAGQNIHSKNLSVKNWKKSSK